MDELGPYWGISLSDWAQLVTIGTGLAMFGFSITPKGIRTFVAIVNWYRVHILNDQYIYRLERVERAVNFLEEEFGFDLDDYKRSNPPPRP